jgi:hypothetical protein
VSGVKKLVIFILAALFLVSCDRRDQIPEIPEMPDSTEESGGHRNHMGDILNFHSEEELHDYFRGGIRGESEESSVVTPTHYYKFKNPPPEAVVLNMSIAHHVIVRYDTQQEEVGNGQLNIQYIHTLQYDIETEGIWKSTASIRKEDFNAELDGIKYYIWYGRTSGVPVTWNAEWVNEDGYNMVAHFPLRFTADEVLGYVSDLERVEIG